MPDFLKNISPTEMIILAIIIILLFGSKVLISLGKTAGESIREIKKVKKSIVESVDDNDSNKKEVPK
jgi:TatA/E family protein of Tat protein translocase